MERVHERVSIPLAAALAFVGLIMGGLLAGYEPVGGDPEALYRPIKTELARALRQGTLPFWSDRFGIGMPLVAESHMAAFYPPNWLFYRLLDVSSAYRVSMWLHYLALVATTYFYARELEVAPWGSALAGLSFALCGFQASHSCHEPFYHILPYLSLTLMLAEGYMARGGIARPALLALTLGAQLTLGHFQLQTWTAGLVILTGLWRATAQGRPWRRVVGLAIAVAWAFAVAAAQLGLTWELVQFAGFNRALEFMAGYSFPPEHWAQLALPRLYMGFRGGVRSFYWGGQGTSADEACLYVGTLTLILAIVGSLGKHDRALAPWRWLVPIAFILATMPRWFPEGYGLILRLPGIGYFRAPGRYVLFTSLGLCLLAGRGFDRALGARRVKSDLPLAVVIGVVAFAWAAVWSGRDDVRRAMDDSARLLCLAEAGASWLIGLSAVVLLRRGKVPPVTLLLLAALELGYLYHQGTTPWGWPLAFPRESPVFQVLSREQDVGLVAGRLYDLPIRAGFTPAYPYVGIVPPPPSYLLEASTLPSGYTPLLERWLARAGVTHGVFEGPFPFRPGTVLYLGRDPILDAIYTFTAGPLRSRLWRVERYAGAFPEARAACEVEHAELWNDLYPALTTSADPNVVWFLSKDQPRDPPGPRARSAKVVRWDGRSGLVDHDGTCDLVLRRVYYPGWSARVDGVETPVVPADGGFQSIRIPGAGVSTVTTRYRPTRLYPLVAVSVFAVTLAMVALAVGLRNSKRIVASGARG